LYTKWLKKDRCRSPVEESNASVKTTCPAPSLAVQLPTSSLAAIGTGGGGGGGAGPKRLHGNTQPAGLKQEAQHLSVTFCKETQHLFCECFSYVSPEPVSVK
jgi:hypothetical protein